MISFTKEQIYIVTGASSGLGEATALLLNELGASVVAIARNEDRLNAMRDRCKYPENMHIEVKDLTEDIDGLPKYVKSLKEKYGKFSGMAYCAGISLVSSIKSIDMYEMQNIFNINYFAPLFMSKGFLDKRNNIGKGTSLVVISSVDAKLATKGQFPYSGSKAAIMASMKSLSKEVAANGTRINCVLPSMIKTPMTQNNQVTYITDPGVNDEYPFGWGEPNDVANMIVYLLSDKSKYISGQNYIIDSGGVV